jgi:hypothetical protein
MSLPHKRANNLKNHFPTYTSKGLELNVVKNKIGQKGTLIYY